MCIYNVILLTSTLHVNTVFEQIGREYRSRVVALLQFGYTSGILVLALVVTTGRSIVSIELITILPTVLCVYFLLLVTRVITRRIGFKPIS